MDTHDQHVLVVRAVEDADLAGSGHLLVDAPQEVVANSSGVGCLKLATGVPCGLKAVITRRIVPSLPAASMPWRITSTLACSQPQPVLQVGQPLEVFRGRRLCVVLFQPWLPAGSTWASLTSCVGRHAGRRRSSFLLISEITRAALAVAAR